MIGRSADVEGHQEGSMRPFSYTLKLDQPIDDNVSKAFTDILNELRKGMSGIAQEVRRHQERAEFFQKEVTNLRVANQRLTEENNRLRNQGTGGVAALAPPPPHHSRPTTPPEANDIFQLERTIRIHCAPVHSVKMDPTDETVATASWDASVKLYSLAEDSVVRTFGNNDPLGEAKMGGLYAVAFSKTSPEVLGCTSCDRSVYLWNHTTGTLINKLTGHTDEVNGIDFHSTQMVMCTASDDCKVIIWDFLEGIILRTLDKHTKPVYGTAFLGQENQYLVATCCFDQKTRVFDMRDKQVVQSLQEHNDDVIGISYSSQKQCLATGSDDGNIVIWDTRTWRLQQKINTREDPAIPDNEVKRVSFSENGDLLAAACSSGRVLVYDIRNGSARLHATLGGHGDCVFDVTWGHCNRTNKQVLVSASHDHSCRYWREI